MLNPRMLALGVLVFAFSTGSATSGESDTKTTQQVLQKLSSDMLGMCSKYNQEKQKDTRNLGLQECQQTFQKEINAAEVPQNKPMQAVLRVLIENIDGSTTTFRTEQMNTPRSIYLQACFLIFKKEFPLATDYADVRTTQKSFDLLISLLTTAREGLRRSPASMQTMAYGALNEVVTGIFQAASVPEGDALAQLDKNLTEVRKLFPTSTEKIKVVNQPILSILESRAKEMQQKAAARK